MTTNRVCIAFIGFGELGSRFARDFAARGDIDLAAYDILFGTPAGARLEARAREIGVAIAVSNEAACRRADVVISAVTADRAEAVAGETAPNLARRQLFLDVNSASPSTKRRASAVVEAAGAAYVEGAVMGPVAGPGITVEILAGGAAAARASDLLNAHGAKLTPVATEIGRASAIKLCRSIMIKGIEALMVDCTRATRHWGVEEPVYASLTRTFPGTDWYKLADDMSERVATHGVRRAAEMREASEMLREMGLDGSLAAAVADAQLRGAMPKTGS